MSPWWSELLGSVRLAEDKMLADCWLRQRWKECAGPGARFAAAGTFRNKSHAAPRRDRCGRRLLA